MDGGAPPVPGRLMIVSGPAAAGKDTLIARARAALPSLVKSVSMTTRPRARDEEHGVHYFFVTREEFARHREAGALLEWAPVFDDFYGTPAAWVREQLAAGRDVIMNIDVKGGLQVREQMPEARLIFVMPPEPRLETLRQRLVDRHRDSDTPAAIARRLATAEWEMTQAARYDRIIVNEEADRAAQALIEAIRERT